MKRKSIAVMQAALLVLTIICVLVILNKGVQPKEPGAKMMLLNGEYSIDGEIWLPFDESTVLPVTDGELWIRGHLNVGLPRNGSLFYYCDHLGVSIDLNGENIYINNVYRDSNGLKSEGLWQTCGRAWERCVFEDGVSSEDVVLFKLNNPHRYGNSYAYREFVQTLSVEQNNGSGDIHQINTCYKQLFLLAATSCIIVTIILFVGIVVALIMHIHVARFMFGAVVLTLFVGLDMLLDVSCISLHVEQSGLITFFRAALEMLMIWLIIMIPAKQMKGKLRKVACTMTGITGVIDAGILLISCTDMVLLCNMFFIWSAIQFLASALMVILCMYEMTCSHGNKAKALLMFIVLNIAVLLDICGVGRSMYFSLICIKNTFMICFALFMIWLIVCGIANRQGTDKVRALERELYDNRIAMTLSQVQPHFIYNTLTTISQMCLTMPQEASKLTEDFSLYLRSNIDELNSREPIPIEKEIQHVKYYADIECARFPDISIEFDLKSKNFMLPALSVQTLVENSVKHGLMKRKHGGSILISTKETSSEYIVSVWDDGVGFEANKPVDERVHLGIMNVRSRIFDMCGGSLVVESKPGVETIATIRIPKEEQE